MKYYIYTPNNNSFADLIEAATALRVNGYDTASIRLGRSWEEFLGEVPRGATIVVYSVDFFPSLMELLSTLASLQEREIVLKSLQEPWLSGKIGSTTDFLLKLRSLALVLHQNRTQAGIAKARAAGKKIGRPRKRGEQVK